MELYFLRHGIAADAGPHGSGDAGRPLTKEGIAKMQSAAQTAHEGSGQTPAVVLPHSPASQRPLPQMPVSSESMMARFVWNSLSAVTAPIMGNDPVALRQKEQQLRIPIVGRQRPAMMEDNRLCILRTPVLVEYFDAVLGRDVGHVFSFRMRIFCWAWLETIGSEVASPRQLRLPCPLFC